MTAGNSLSENECFSRRKWTSTTLSSASGEADGEDRPRDVDGLRRGRQVRGAASGRAAERMPDPASEAPDPRRRPGSPRAARRIGSVGGGAGQLTRIGWLDPLGFDPPDIETSRGSSPSGHPVDASAHLAVERSVRVEVLTKVTGPRSLLTNPRIGYRGSGTGRRRGWTRPRASLQRPPSRTASSRHEPAAHDRREDLGRPRRRPGAGRAGGPRGRPPPRPRGHLAAGVHGASRPRPAGPPPGADRRHRGPLDPDPLRAPCRWPTRWPRPRSTS